MACDRERLDGITAAAPRSAITARNPSESYLIAEHIFAGKTANQFLSLANIVELPWGQDEAHRIAESVNADVDLGAQAAARTPDRLIFVPPFGRRRHVGAPAQSWNR